MQKNGEREKLLALLQKKIGYEFSDRTFLEEALTHSSYANENAVPCNERLEFLGDAVLELVVSEKLFAAYPACDEGLLTSLRAHIVCKESLSEWGSRIGLKKLIRLGNNFKKCGANDSVTADCAEALFGAVFADGGYAAAVSAAAVFLADKDEFRDPAVKKNPKSELQEYTQAHSMGLPRYETVEHSGPDHALNFKVRLTVGARVLSEEWGRSKKEAEFSAAERALEKLRSEKVHDENTGQRPV